MSARTDDGGFPLELLDRLVEKACAAGAEQAEAYGERSESRRIKVFKGEVEELTSSTRRGVGLRVFRGERMGHASTSDLSEEALDDLVRRTLAHAAVVDPDPDVVLVEGGQRLPDLRIYDERLHDIDVPGRIELALRTERAAMAHDPRMKLVETTMYADAEASAGIVSTSGLRQGFREGHSYLFLYALAEQEDQVETGVAYSVGRYPGELDPEGCGREAAERAVRLLGAAPCPSMKATAVLQPFAGADVVNVLGAALTADAVQKQRSLFAALEGKQVAAPLLTLLDDGRHPDGLASAPFDGEGTPCQSTPLIEDGVLQGFLYDARTAHRASRRSTGNGVRGSYQSIPSVHPTNLIVKGAQTPVADIVAGIEHGVLVTDAVGVHSGANPVSGEFSVGISGILIESGRLTRPLREVTLAGDILSMLGGIAAIGDDARWIPGGSVLMPTLAIEGMSIAGT